MAEGLPSTASMLHTTSKVKERQHAERKAILNPPAFVSAVWAWQEKRPPLLEADTDLELLIILLLGEIQEVEEHRQLEGLPDYDFVSETGETIDVGFFIASLERLAYMSGQATDFHRVMQQANGQSNGSRAIDGMREVTGNLTMESLKTDLDYLWTLWVSYLIHMKFPVNPNETLAEYTFPKNNGNYPEELLRGNPLFEMTFERKMNPDERTAYFAHMRKANRLIRDFIVMHVDPMVEHTGLRPEHYRPYKFFIFNFMSMNGTGISPQMALEMLETELYRDYKVDRDGVPKILRPNSRLPN